MPRKKATDLQAQRAEIARRYRRGPKAEKRALGNEAKLTEQERLVKMEVACHLKAQDFSYKYIASALHVTEDIVKKWFADDALALNGRVVEIQDDLVGGAVTYLKTYAIELVEMLLEIARTTPDDKLALQAITEGLDRMGLTKVNKSESAASIVQENRETVDITDKSGLIERLRNAPPEVQAQAAEHMEAMMALTSEFTDANVTHA